MAQIYASANKKLSSHDSKDPTNGNELNKHS